MTKHKVKPLNPELMSALNTIHEAAEDMPDGAWWAMLEDTVREFNTRTHNGYEPNDAVHTWIRTSGIFKVHPNIPKVPALPINLPESQVECFQLGWRNAVISIHRSYWKRMGKPLTDIEETRMVNLMNRFIK